ncbi:MAG: hypothetical protein P1U40_13605 [Coxiellaceae bacterium]|nr:hypothetical protein [Coxiellaceae bacterium]
MKKLIAVGLLCAFSMATALPWDAKDVHTNITSQAAPSNQLSQQRVKRILQWFNAADSDRTLFTKSNMQHYFASNINYTVNGVVAAQGVDASSKRFAAMLKNIKHYHVKFPLKAMVANNNEAVFVYQLSAKLVDGHSYTDWVAVNAHFNKHGKVDQWHAVIEHC